MDFEFFMHFYEGPGDFLNDSLIIVDLFLLVFETFLTHSGGLYRTGCVCVSAPGAIGHDYRH